MATTAAPTLRPAVGGTPMRTTPATVPPSQKVVVILYDDERDAVVSDVAKALTDRGVMVQTWYVPSGRFDVSSVAPGVGTNITYLNRCIAATATPDPQSMATALIAWLQWSGCRVINGGSLTSAYVTSSRVAQYIAARAAGLRIPQTFVCSGPKQTLRALSLMTHPNRPVILRTVTGDQVFSSVQAATRAVTYYPTPQHLPPSNSHSVTPAIMVQAYIAPMAPRDYIYRFYFVGDRLTYVLRIARHVTTSSTMPTPPSQPHNYPFTLQQQPPPQEPMFIILLRPDKEIAYAQMAHSTAGIEQFVSKCLQLKKNLQVDMCTIDARLDEDGQFVFDGLDTRINVVKVAEKGAQLMYKLPYIPSAVDAMVALCMM